MARIILAFNGDLESRLALHWLVHERGCQVITLLINLGQEAYLEPLGELALEPGATSALARYVIAQELVRAAQEEGCDTVAHAAASKGNDQVRMETAIAALGPQL